MSNDRNFVSIFIFHFWSNDFFTFIYRTKIFMVYEFQKRKEYIFIDSISIQYSQNYVIDSSIVVRWHVSFIMHKFWIFVKNRFNVFFNILFNLPCNLRLIGRDVRKKSSYGFWWISSPSSQLKQYGAFYQYEYVNLLGHS